MPFDNVPAKEDPVLQRLRIARRRLERGWVKGRSLAVTCIGGTMQRSYCTTGAIRYDDVGKKMDNDDVTTAALLAVGQTILRKLGEDSAGYRSTTTISIAGWNDGFHRTHEEVLQMMDEAIRAREEATNAVR